MRRQFICIVLFIGLAITNPSYAQTKPVRTEEVRSDEPNITELTIGETLEARCGQCSFHPDERVLEVGKIALGLPRGYDLLILNGVEKPIPVSPSTSYDKDLADFEQIVNAWNDSSHLRLVLSPDSAGKLPTPWLVGVLLFWPQAWPVGLYEQAQARRDELVALKTIRYSEQVAERLDSFQN